ncbi:ABC transporter substrate-binding protein [Stakelama saccharophila]|uniref:ABC transporter substrate-binding protein n=1 Tax=Stakelama saccharophila TaxID=3075605 RepID=A0ABZ0B702_9SPHN|nr:ABC transporter substrate-binding protein [Stakelama sp. W311]WNO53070.1 ABC transporter substrate-binding protein [Stakelama sp. W311]
MNRLPFLLLLPLAILTTSGCQRRADDLPVVVSAIGDNADPADPDRGTIDFPSRLVMASIAQGLLRFDAAGQIEPGLAERWIMIDEGQSYIFRLREAYWSDGSPVTAQSVARVLNRAIHPESRNPLAPYLSSVEEVVAMTPEVVEIRLKRPRPDLLRLFAAPELGIFDPGSLRGSGPFRLEPRRGPLRHLRPVPNAPTEPTETEGAPSPDEEAVDLIAERAARALARFQDKKSDLILGGTYLDWPVLQVSGVDGALQHLDPAQGLFGLAIVGRDGFLSDAANRRALSMAIDRDTLLDRFRQGWTADLAILPQQDDSGSAPTLPDWAGMSLPERQAEARQQIAAWAAAQEEEEEQAIAPLRIALPDAPGANLLWRGLRDSLRAVGLAAQRVPADADADLRVIDAVAPARNARWYLRTACRSCSEATMDLLQTARTAPDMAGRARSIAEADAAIAAEVPYIPLARPLRWSVVGPRLDAWQANLLAWHPLNHLRGDPR